MAIRRYEQFSSILMYFRLTKNVHMIAALCQITSMSFKIFHRWRITDGSNIVWMLLNTIIGQLSGKFAHVKLLTCNVFLGIRSINFNFHLRLFCAR